MSTAVVATGMHWLVGWSWQALCAALDATSGEIYAGLLADVRSRELWSSA